MNVYIKKQNFLWKKILVGIIILIVLILLLNTFQLFIRNSFYLASSPLLTFFQKSGKSSSILFESFLYSKSLKSSNDALMQENQKLLFEAALLKETLRENQLEKEALQNAKNSNFKIVLTKVIGLDYSNDFILIDKGLDDGIEENMSVMSSQKVIYGKIFKVYKNFSQVMLISNKNSVIDVKIQNEELSQNTDKTDSIDKENAPIYGAIKGHGNLSLFLDLIDYNAKVQENDVLITSGLEGIFPRNLLVGKIKSVYKDDLKPFQTADIQPFFDVKNIDNLFIITDYRKDK